MRNKRIHSPDLATAIMLIVFSAAGFFLNLEHPMGSARRMGPGYLPFLTFLLLTAIGIVLLVRGLVSGPVSQGKWAWRENWIILIALVAFGLTIEHLGIILSIFITVMISSYAEPVFKPVRAAAGAAVLIFICVTIFVWGLDIRLPLFPWSQ